MKVSINFNNEVQNFKTIKEAIKFLNSAFYYANDLTMYVNSLHDYFNYSELKSIRRLVNDSNFYNEPIQVIQNFE